MARVEPFKLRGADIEIFEAVTEASDHGVIKPNRIRINGTEIITTGHGEITVEPIPFGKGIVVVSISKIICRSLSFSEVVTDAEG